MMKMTLNVLQKVSSLKLKAALNHLPFFSGYTPSLSRNMRKDNTIKFTHTSGFEGGWIFYKVFN